MAETEKPKPQLQLKLKPDVITNFSYSFSQALLQKLKELQNEGRVFEVPVGVGSYCQHFTPIAKVVIHHLGEQLNHITPSRQECVEELIKVAEEFLAIFEKRESGT